MKNEANKSKAFILRQNAEDLLKSKPYKKGSHITEADTLKLIHELEVHQIELELQNDELMLTRSQAQSVADRYTELYDFAPSGYFTLSKEGEIVELNLYGSQMLGKERLSLIKSKFGFFVSDETKPVFNLFLENTFKNKKRETCEVVLIINDNLPMYVHIDGLAIDNGKQSLLSVMDITVNIVADALKRKTEELEQFNNIMVGREMKMIELKREINHLLKKAGGEAKYIIHE